MPAARIPDGTSYRLPAEVRQREAMLRRLQELFDSWGYQPVDLPALEVFDPAHPAARNAFKLVDTDNSLLALRSDFTPALSKLVRQHFRQAAAGAASLRLQYRGTTWSAIGADLAHAREFTQVGIELIGVSSPRADAELIHLARESVRSVGLTPRIEIGNPALVRALFDEASVPDSRRDELAGVIDRKDAAGLRALLAELQLGAEFERALTLIPDLYGEKDVLKRARARLTWEPVRRELERVELLLEQFEDDSDLMLDLGVARRLSYYTGVTFRAYTFDYGQPLLGGGRYDGALLPYAAGFSLGLDRLLGAGPAPAERTVPHIMSSDDAAARLLRRHGYTVVRSLSDDEAHLRAEAVTTGASFIVQGGQVAAVGSDTGLLRALQQLLDGAEL